MPGSLPVPAAQNASFNLPAHQRVTVSRSGVLNEEAAGGESPSPGGWGCRGSLKKGKRDTGGCGDWGARPGAFSGGHAGREGSEAAGAPGHEGSEAAGEPGCRGCGTRRESSSHSIAGGKPRTQRGEKRGLN